MDDELEEDGRTNDDIVASTLVIRLRAVYYDSTGEQCGAEVFTVGDVLTFPVEAISMEVLPV